MHGYDASYWRAEAERLDAENTALRTRIGELDAQVAAVSEKLTSQNLFKVVLRTA